MCDSGTNQMKMQRTCKIVLESHSCTRMFERSSTYASESELGGDQGLPFVRLVFNDQLCCNSCNELPKAQTELIGTDHEAANLERCDLRYIGDQYGLGEADSQTNKTRQHRASSAS